MQIMGSSLKTLRIIIVGPIGSGKTTISKYIVKEFPNFVHIASGDIMRQEIIANTELGQQVKLNVANGILVPDELIVGIMFKELQKSAKKNWILDGFPRTVNQAQLLHGTEACKECVEPCRNCPCDNKGLLKHPVDGVVHLIVPDEVVIERTSKRWTHLPSGRVYSAGFQEPRVKWIDDETGEKLVQRLDDQPAVVAERLKIYKNLTEPVLDFYRYHDVNVLDLENYKKQNAWPPIKKFLRELSQKQKHVQ